MIGRPVLPAVLLAALAVPASAGAVIVPGKGMFGIEIGMTDQQVLAVHPDPSGNITDRGGTTTYTYVPEGVKVSMDPDSSNTHYVVNHIVTTCGAERTAEGVGVGTAERNLRAKLAGERCRTFRVFSPDRRDCYFGPCKAGTIVTLFHEGLKSHIVRSVTVARVLD